MVEQAATLEVEIVQLLYTWFRIAVVVDLMFGYTVRCIGCELVP